MLTCGFRVRSREWADIFARENSGLYPNQWMIVDYNLFEPGAQELPDYLLTVCLRGRGIRGRGAGVGECMAYSMPSPGGGGGVYGIQYALPTRKRWVLPVPVGVIRDMACHGRHGEHAAVLWGLGKGCVSCG
jgi:hypothetical protein